MLLMSKVHLQNLDKWVDMQNKLQQCDNVPLTSSLKMFHFLAEVCTRTFLARDSILKHFKRCLFTKMDHKMSI